MKIVLLFLLSAMLLTTAYSQSSSASNNPTNRTISVEGSAEMEIIPDEIYTAVTLREYEKRNTGKIDIETIKANFLQNCKAIGIADSSISVDSYAGISNYGWWKRGKKREELNNAIIYQIKFSSLDLIDKLIAKLDDDATENFVIVRTSHSRIREFRKQLKISAVKAAKDKATYLAEAIDEKIGNALTIEEPSEVDFIPVGNRISQTNVAVYEDKLQPSLIEFKKIRLLYSAKVVFALK